MASPGRYTAHDLARIISDVIERSIPAERIDADTFLDAVLGDPTQFPYEAEAMRAITDRYSSHDFIGNPNVLTWLLGRSPVTFAQFVAREYDAHRQPPPRGRPCERQSHDGRRAEANYCGMTGTRRWLS